MQVQNNVNPAGQIGGEPVPGGQQFTYTVRSQGRLVTPEQFGKIVIRANPDGSILRLKDVARIELGAQTYNVHVRYNGQICGRHGHLPVARLQCSRYRRRCQQEAGRVAKELSAGSWSQQFRWIPPRPSPRECMRLSITLGMRWGW